MTEDQVADCAGEIRRHADPSSPRYGMLLNWNHGFVWHYGIGLSERHIFDTGQWLRVFEEEHPARFVIGVDEIHFRPDQTIERLIHAIRLFREWHYGLLGWNCEHLARLVATDDPVSYEVREKPWPIPDLNHGGWHPTAREELRAHLREVAPDLVAREERGRLSLTPSGLRP